MRIYLDYSATTPPRSEVIELISRVLQQEWGNPSSLHQWGTRSATIMERARMQVAKLINAPNPDHIVFTSGGTESNNLAIWGIARQYSTPQHMIISSVEHPAIAEPVKLLEETGWDISRLPVDSTGKVQLDDLKQAIRSNTVLISIIYGQSEVGTLQDIEAIASLAKSYHIPIHTDAVQVIGRKPIDIETLGIDLLSLSGHKFYGPLGIGALYVRPPIKLIPLLAGGGQEYKLRSGTQAVPMIAGLGLAAELIQAELTTEIPRLKGLQDILLPQLNDIEELQLTGHPRDRLVHHLSFCLNSDYKGKLTGKSIVRQMNKAGIGISAGSACHSGKAIPSPILLAMGYSPTVALTSIRITLGRDTTEADIDYFALVLKQILHDHN